ARAESHLRADDAVAAVEAGRHVEHVHRAAPALGRTPDAAGQLGHDFLRVHARGQHVAVVAVTGDDLVVALFDALLNANRHGLLADVQVAEAADQPHAVELARALLEATDQDHLAVVAQQVLLRGLRRVGDTPGLAGISFGRGGFRHPSTLPAGPRPARPLVVTERGFSSLRSRKAKRPRQAVTKVHELAAEALSETGWETRIR